MVEVRTDDHYEKSGHDKRGGDSKENLGGPRRCDHLEPALPAALCRWLRLWRTERRLGSVIHASGRRAGRLERPRLSWWHRLAGSTPPDPSAMICVGHQTEEQDQEDRADTDQDRVHWADASTGLAASDPKIDGDCLKAQSSSAAMSRCVQTWFSTPAAIAGVTWWPPAALVRVAWGRAKL
jgi:hypothetical protein